MALQAEQVKGIINISNIGSPVRQYAFVSMLVVCAALIAVNVVSSQVERNSVISRLETEAIEPAQLGTFRIVEELSKNTAPSAGMLLTLPDDSHETDRLVMQSFVGQQVARVDMIDKTGRIFYSTDENYLDSVSDFDPSSTRAVSEYVGAAAIAGLDGHSVLIEAVITTVPVFKEGGEPATENLEMSVVIFRDVTTAIDAATAAGARFRLLMTVGVMTVVFATLMIVVIRGHRAQTAARNQLETLLENERALVDELDQSNADLKAADEERLRLLSVVTHELGNPLTSISAFANLLSRNKTKNLTDKQISMLSSIRGSEQRMRTLLRDLQDLSMVESGAMRLEFDNIELKELVTEVVRSMEPISDERGQQLELLYSSKIEHLEIDRIRVSQVVTNLISNASKYSPTGSEIVVEVVDSFESVTIAVSDNGIGISSEDQAKLFTPFFRADNYETREMPGTGLGLVICRQIAELNGGELSVESVRGSGSTFTLAIPKSRSVRSNEAA